MSLPMAPPAPLGWRWVGRLLLVMLAYHACGRLALAFPHAGSLVSLLWAPAGIALAAQLRWGRAQAAAVAVGAFSVNLTVGAPAWVALGMALGNALAAFSAAEWLKRQGFGRRMERRR